MLLLCVGTPPNGAPVSGPMHAHWCWECVVCHVLEDVLPDPYGSVCKATGCRTTLMVPSSAALENHALHLRAMSLQQMARAITRATGAISSGEEAWLCNQAATCVEQALKVERYLESLNAPGIPR